jgi:hypothetical protein
MLRDRATTVDLFALVPALELRFEPELAEQDRLLEDDQIFRQVKADLSRRRPHTTEVGRPSTPVEVILRLLVVQHLYDWSYAQTEHFVGDSLVPLLLTVFFGTICHTRCCCASWRRTVRGWQRQLDQARQMLDAVGEEDRHRPPTAVLRRGVAYRELMVGWIDSVLEGVRRNEGQRDNGPSRG